MVEYTEKLIHELATLGMMEHSPQTATVAGDKTSCQINSLFLDYIISRETEENIFLPLEVFVLRGESSLNTQRAGQHLAIASSWKRDKFVFDSLDFSQLRSLTVSREWRTFFVSDRMRVLRHTFGVLNISVGAGKAILNALKNLTQLHKLGVSGINRSNIKGFFSAIATDSHMQSLSLQLHKDKDYDWLENKITPPENLRRLKMHVHVEKFQHWSCLKVLGQTRRLQSLSLRFKTDHDVELQFCDRLDSAAWSTPGQFCELKVLEIACSSNLHVKFAEREMNDLELLKIHCLDGSSLQLSGIEHPPSLMHVCLMGSFDDTVKEELRRKVGKHPRSLLASLIDLACPDVFSSSRSQIFSCPHVSLVAFISLLFLFPDNSYFLLNQKKISMWNVMYVQLTVCEGIVDQIPI
ncbi:hypothetical protein HU200_034621 [Digitaria exilis]|uniref:Uncharacterized protein n=1 Tax=Digitaria exilis TaxID=1010633 RepID=A0A835BQ01_9POAL|nr:hypothetical protein HU200_034621 [Digitaria exilis]